MIDPILRRKQVEEAVGLRKSAIYAAIARGEFPAPIRLGRRAVGWRASDITQWLESRARAAGSRAAA